MAAHTVAVLGGGIGGIVAARRLRRELDSGDRVVLVDREANYRFAPSFLWVMSGARRPGQVTRDRHRLSRRGIDVLTADVLEIDAPQRRVTTTHGDLRADRLVVALGAELAPDLIPGFSDGAHDIYTLDGVARARTALERFEGGHLVVFVSRMPFKCPAAPYEAAFLAEAAVRRRGVRDHTTIDIYTPEPYPMPTAGPELGHALEAMLAERGIGFHPGATVERVDTEADQLVLAEGRRVEYDLLLGVPPHRPPELVRQSGLADDTGFAPVDRTTLATGMEGVSAIGDVTTIPIGEGKSLPKAGVFAEAEANVVARRVADELAGRTPTAELDGKGACFVELGDGRAAYATGDFYAGEGPRVRLRHPGRRWHLAKVALEQFWLRRWL